MPKNVQEVQLEVQQVSAETGKLKVKVQSLEDDVEQVEGDFDELQLTLESIDNNLRRNNIWLQGLKEGVEENGLRQFFEEVFIASLGADCDTTIQISSTFRVGVRKSSATRSRCGGEINKLAD